MTVLFPKCGRNNHAWQSLIFQAITGLFKKNVPFKYCGISLLCPVVFFCLQIQPAYAQEDKQSDEQNFEQKLNALIEQLCGKDEKIRMSAVETLYETGGPALPFLEKALDNPDKQAVKCVKEIIERISAFSAEAGKFGGKMGKDFNVIAVAGHYIIAGNYAMDALEKDGRKVKVFHDLIYAEYLETPLKGTVKCINFAETKDFQAHLRRAGCAVTDSIAGLAACPCCNAIAANSEAGLGAMLHEIAHRMIANELASVPNWFNEGFATFCEDSLFFVNQRTNEILKVQLGTINWRMEGLQQSLKANKYIKLKALISGKQARMSENDIDLFYAEARAIVCFLYRCGLLKNFIQAARKQPDSAKALEETFGIKLSDIEKEWLDWVKKCGKDGDVIEQVKWEIPNDKSADAGAPKKQ